MSAEIFYIMKKRGWNAVAGEYSNVERITGPLSRKQVTTRVNRLPDSTVWLWSIETIQKNPDGTAAIINSTNAEEWQS